MHIQLLCGINSLPHIYEHDISLFKCHPCGCKCTANIPIFITNQPLYSLQNVGTVVLNWTHREDSFVLLLRGRHIEMFCQQSRTFFDDQPCHSLQTCTSHYSILCVNLIGSLKGKVTVLILTSTFAGYWAFIILISIWISFSIPQGVYSHSHAT